MADLRNAQPYDAEDEAELREHFIDGSGAYADSLTVARLLRTLDRDRAAPSPALTREALTEPVLTRVLGEVALVVGGDLLTGGVKHRIALSSAIIERLSALGTPPPAGMDALRQRVIDTARDLNMTMPDLGDGDPMSALDDALADLDEALSRIPPPTEEERDA